MNFRRYDLLTLNAYNSETITASTLGFLFQNDFRNLSLNVVTGHSSCVCVCVCVCVCT